MDVAMNAQGVAVERGYGRPLMSGLHGSYSIGTLLAALAGAGAAHAGVPVPLHLAVAAAVLAVLVWRPAGTCSTVPRTPCPSRTAPCPPPGRGPGGRCSCSA